MSASDKERDPLQAEAAKREEWRGEEISVDPEASGHTPPASEHDDAKEAHGEGQAPRTISPPD